MVSITSGANAYVLSNLRQINNDIVTAQTRIGTGKKINSASDNASVWAMGQTIQADVKAQKDLSTGITIGKARADSGVAAIDTVVKLFGEIKVLSEGAKNTPPANYTAVNAKIAVLKTQIATAIAGAAFQGANFLTEATVAEGKVTVGYVDGAAQTLDLAIVNQSDGAIATFGLIVAMDGAATGAGSAESVSDGVDAAVTTLTAYQAKLSSFSSSLETQGDFLGTITAIQEKALSSLVDANLEEESAKITALQVKQQLAYQALAITNSSSQNILRLFQ